MSEPNDAPTGDDRPAADREPMIDLDTVAGEFDGVEAALRRLDEGTYWTDEVTGDPIPDDVLASDPTARRG